MRSALSGVRTCPSTRRNRTSSAHAVFTLAEMHDSLSFLSLVMQVALSVCDRNRQTLSGNVRPGSRAVAALLIWSPVGCQGHTEFNRLCGLKFGDLSKDHISDDKSTHVP